MTYTQNARSMTYPPWLLTLFIVSAATMAATAVALLAAPLWASPTNISLLLMLGGLALGGFAISVEIARSLNCKADMQE